MAKGMYTWIFIFSLAMLVPWFARADVKADLKVSYQSGDLKGSDLFGKFFFKSGKIRIDLDRQSLWPDPKTFIYDSEEKKLVEISSVRRNYSEMSFDSSLFPDRFKSFLFLGGLTNVDQVDPKNFDVKKIGFEEVGGHLASVYVFKFRWRAGYEAKIWIADDLGGVPVKVESTDPKLRKTTMQLAEIKAEDLSATQFSIPEDYVKVLDEVQKRKAEENKKGLIVVEKQKAELRKNEALRKLDPAQRKQVENFLFGGYEESLKKQP